MVVQQTFTGDVSQLLAELKRLEAQNQKLHTTMAQGAQQSKAHHSEAMHFANEQLASTKRLVAGSIGSFLSIEHAVDGVGEAYARMAEKAKAAGEKLASVNLEALKGVVQAGLEKDAGEVVSGLKNIRGLPPADATQIFQGLHAGSPTMGKEELIATTKAMAPIAQLGLKEDLKTEAERVAMVSTLGAGRTPQQNVDLARVVEQRAGKYADRLFSAKTFPAIREVVGSGAYKDDLAALGELVTAAENDPELAKKLKTALRTTYVAPHGAEAFTAKGKALRGLSKSSADAEKMELFRNNKAAAEAAGVEGLFGLPPEKVAANTAAIRNYMGTTQRQGEQLAKSPEGFAAQRNFSLVAEKEEAERELYGPAGERRARADALHEAEFTKGHPDARSLQTAIESYLDSAGMGLARQAGRLFGSKDPEAFALRYGGSATRETADETAKNYEQGERTIRALERVREAIERPVGPAVVERGGRE